MRQTFQLFTKNKAAKSDEISTSAKTKNCFPTKNTDLRKLNGLLLILLVLMLSCNKSNDNGSDSSSVKPIDQLVVNKNFNWSTGKDITFNIIARDNMDNPLSNIRFNIYTASPDSEGVYISGGVTDASGVWTVIQSLPSYLTTVTITTDYLGLIREKNVSITGSSINVVFGGKGKNIMHQKSSEIPLKKVAGTQWVYMGAYNSKGVPNYLLSPNDPVDASLLDDLNATLPERKSVPIYHPEFIASTVPNNLNLIETCDVWITYITEGATWLNSLGFFVFNTNQPPQSAAQIDTIHIIFPNLSNSGSGGGLFPGNKVYLGRFPAGKSLGWVVIPNGWKNNGVSVGSYVLYSIPEFNPESSPSLKKHMLILRDPTRLEFMYSFEDWRRDDRSCDNDFNDGVLYVKASPVTAVNTDGMPVIVTTQPDTDGDGIPDNFDDYPNDASKAFNNWYPSKTTYGTLAFEDNWPSRGDYDFNDLVVGYRFNQITNAQNKVVQVTATLITEAMGASFHNALGFQLPVAPADVASVTGTDLRHALVNVAANHTETGQSKAVIFAYDDAYDRLPSNCGIGANTELECPYVTADTMHLTINLTNPVSLSAMGTPPYNPFIVKNQIRGMEIHLPDFPPTDKADVSLFGTDIDDSQPALERYYKTKTNLPWAINILDKFNYVIEKTPVNEGFLKFNSWAESAGANFPDWYKPVSGYRDDTKIYTHP